MKRVVDERAIAEFAERQRGVFSKADLQVLLAEPHAAGLVRRIRNLEEGGTLRRFSRGWYVAESFDLATLSQRIAPRSYVSFGTVLARELLVGPRPDRQLIAAKVGRTRTYAAFGYEIVHVRIAPHLDFGHTPTGGVEYADPEKAVLDVLYFHLRGRPFPFDIYSDIDFGKLDRKRLNRYLDRYRNPKFIAFVRGVLEVQ